MWVEGSKPKVLNILHFFFSNLKASLMIISFHGVILYERLKKCFNFNVSIQGHELSLTPSLSLSLFLSLLSDVHAGQNVRTFGLFFTLNYQPAFVGESVSVGPEMITSKTRLYWLLLHVQQP